MFSFIWPIGLIVISNIMYQICAKSVPEGVSPFASLTVTYLVGAVFSVLMFCLTSRGENLFQQLSKLNWAPFVLGVVLVGLEAGFIYAYQVGWQVSTASTVQSSILAIALIFVGFLMYNEGLSWNKLVGVGACLVGIIFINLK